MTDSPDSDNSTDPTDAAIASAPGKPLASQESDSEKSRRVYNACYAACIAGFKGVAKDELIDLAIECGARPESDRREMAERETEESLRGLICDFECGNASGGGGSGGSGGSGKATLELQPPLTKAPSP